MNTQRLRRITGGALVALAALVFSATEWVGGASHSKGFVSQGPQGNRPIEETAKNIQVLKGLPASQLFPLMNFVSASLGVRCNHCHVRKEGADNWVWESDEKESKRTARRMMQMVLAVNRDNRADFRDNSVTCYTCHRGQLEPVARPPLPLTASGHEDDGAKPAVASSSSSLPSVEQVFSRYVEAVGGAAAARPSTRVLKGTREATQGRVWPLEVMLKAPDKYLVRVTTPQGVIEQGLNGAAGWYRNPREARAATPEEVVTLKQAAELYQAVKVTGPTPAMKVVGREKVGERDAYVVESKPTAGVTERLFFDSQTGLLLRRLTLNDTLLLPIPEQTDFEDYREVDGIKLPFTIRISNIDTFFSSTRKFTEIKHNVAVEDSTFEMPRPPAPRP